MIHPYSHENLSLWKRDVHQVQLDLPGRQLPMGWCDGTEEDEEELRAMAREEGVEHLTIHKKLLKTGRQIWTVGDPPELDYDDED